MKIIIVFYVIPLVLIMLFSDMTLSLAYVYPFIMSIILYIYFVINKNCICLVMQTIVTLTLFIGYLTIMWNSPTLSLEIFAIIVILLIFIAIVFPLSACLIFSEYRSILATLLKKKKYGIYGLIELFVLLIVLIILYIAIKDTVYLRFL